MPITELYTAITEHIDRVNLIRGGARSGKTYALIQMAIKWLIYGKVGPHEIKDGIAIIARETFPALRRTVLREFIDVMHQMNLMKFVEWRKSTHEFKFQGRDIMFLSLDQESKILGMQTKWIWLNEANPISYNIFQQMFLRCEHFAFLDYNPYDDEWLKNELEDKRMKTLKDVSLTVSTYHNNPYLPESIKKEIEDLKYTDLDMYNVYAKGEWVKAKGRIFPNFELVDDLPTSFDKEYAGLDYGYSNDPTALIQVRQVGKELYLKEHLYQTGLLNTDIVDYIKNNLFGIKIIADNAEQKSIEEMKRARIRVKAAWKGKDSVMQGIQYVKQHKLFVLKDSVNLMYELKHYKYQRDATGIYINKPEDKHNHLCDALRYCVQSHSRVFKIKVVGWFDLYLI